MGQALSDRAGQVGVDIGHQQVGVSHAGHVAAAVQGQGGGELGVEESGDEERHTEGRPGTITLQRDRWRRGVARARIAQRDAANRIEGVVVGVNRSRDGGGHPGATATCERHRGGVGVVVASSEQADAADRLGNRRVSDQGVRTDQAVVIAVHTGRCTAAVEQRAVGILRDLAPHRHGAAAQGGDAIDRPRRGGVKNLQIRIKPGAGGPRCADQTSRQHALEVSRRLCDSAATRGVGCLIGGGAVPVEVAADHTQWPAGAADIACVEGSENRADRCCRVAGRHMACDKGIADRSPVGVTNHTTNAARTPDRTHGIHIRNRAGVVAV